jgi:hypothetical protein
MSCRGEKERVNDQRIAAVFMCLLLSGFFMSTVLGCGSGSDTINPDGGNSDGDADSDTDF